MNSKNPTKEYYAVPTNGVVVDEDLDLGGEQWVALSYPGVAADYYQVSTNGVVRSASGRLLKSNKQSNQWYVSLKRPEGSLSTNTSVRVDKVVLSSFRGLRRDQSPVHLNGDFRDCRLSNLTYGEPTPTELSAMQGAQRRLSAMQGARRCQEQRATENLNKTPKKMPSPAGGSAGVEVLRVYRVGSLTLTVSEKGLGEVSKKARLTTADMEAYVTMFAQAAEMNKLMTL